MKNTKEVVELKQGVERVLNKIDKTLRESQKVFGEDALLDTTDEVYSFGVFIGELRTLQWISRYLCNSYRLTELKREVDRLSGFIDSW